MNSLNMPFIPFLFLSLWLVFEYQASASGAVSGCCHTTPTAGRESQDTNIVKFQFNFEKFSDDFDHFSDWTTLKA